LKHTDFLFLTTCFNRKYKTLFSIKSICDVMPSNCNYKIILIDNNSNDGTCESIEMLNNERISVFKTRNNCYWAEGMVYGFKIIESIYSFKYLVPFNDDIRLKKNWWKIIRDDIKSIDLITQDFVLSGCFCENNGVLSYSGFKSLNKFYPLKLKIQVPKQKIINVDTINFNFVVISKNVIDKFGFLDSVYSHSLADLDYGFKLSRNKIPVYISSEYIGYCDRNPTYQTSGDKSLSFFKRIYKLHSKKEQPFFIRFYFFLKNGNIFGFFTFFIVYLSFLLDEIKK